MLPALLSNPAWSLSEKKYNILVQNYWEHIRGTHFNRQTGTPYWIEKCEEFSIKKPQNVFDKLSDFLGNPISLCDEAVMKIKPISYFIPKSLQKNGTKIFTSSGSVGRKKEVAWSLDALEYASEYVNYSFDRNGISRGIDWLIQGPYGVFQTIVGNAITKRDGLIHSAGVETRNLKKYLSSTSIRTPESEKFLEITMGPSLEFTEDILAKENIGGLVTALPLLPTIKNFKGFDNIEAIYLSGMEIPKDMYAEWREKLPEIKFISSFGHHNLGFSYSMPMKGEPYYPPAPLSFVYVVDENEPFEVVDYGDRGRHRILRMEESTLWSQLDRDWSTRVPPQEEFKWDGFVEVQPTF